MERESIIKIPAHYVHEDWMDDWNTVPPELAHDILLSDEESGFDAEQHEHEQTENIGKRLYK